MKRFIFFLLAFCLMAAELGTARNHIDTRLQTLDQLIRR